MTSREFIRQANGRYAYLNGIVSKMYVSRLCGFARDSIGACMAELFEMTAVELGALLARREVSAREIAEAVFRRIDSAEPKVRAYLTLTRDRAMLQAA